MIYYIYVISNIQLYYIYITSVSSWYYDGIVKEIKMNANTSEQDRQIRESFREKQTLVPIGRTCI